MFKDTKFTFRERLRILFDLYTVRDFSYFYNTFSSVSMLFYLISWEVDDDFHPTNNRAFDSDSSECISRAVRIFQWGSDSPTRLLRFLLRKSEWRLCEYESSRSFLLFTRFIFFFSLSPRRLTIYKPWEKLHFRAVFLRSNPRRY